MKYAADMAASDDGTLPLEDLPADWPPPSKQTLIDTLRYIDRNYGRVSASTRRFWLAEWIREAAEHLGQFRCLDDLQSALLEIDEGKKAHPLLARQHTAGRPSLGRREFEVRCTAALAVDALVAAGLSAEEAAKEVAMSLSRRGIHIPRSENPQLERPAWKVIKDWRDEAARIARGKGKHLPSIRRVAASYMHQRQRLPQLVRDRAADPRRLAAAILRNLPAKRSR